MKKLSNWEVSNEDILIINNQPFFVCGGTRLDHYGHFIYKDGNEIDVFSIPVADVQRIIRHTCYVDTKHNRRRIYEGDVFLITPNGSDSQLTKATVEVDNNNYPYYFFRTDDRELLDMVDCEWNIFIESEADKFLATYEKENV